jgi:hypothetical protein
MMSRTKSLLVICAFSVAASLPGVGGAIDVEGQGKGVFDLAYLQLEDERLTDQLGFDTLPVRKSDFRPESGVYPSLSLRVPDPQEANAKLEAVVTQFLGKQGSSLDLQDKGDIVHASVGSSQFWVSRASGAYSVSDSEAGMSQSSTLKDHRQAVRLALRHIVSKGLIQTVDGEQLDVVSVHQIETAATYADESEPFLRQSSDYIVVFGRRYRGIPVIGSYLLVRLGPEGELTGARKVWREITGLRGGETQVVSERIPELIRAQLEQTDAFVKAQNGEGIKIVNTACGYIEAYVSNRQEVMGLGCVVHYRQPRDEMIPQALIPLTEYDFPVAGKRVRFEPAKTKKQVKPEVREDSEDTGKDEMK